MLVKHGRAQHQAEYDFIVSSGVFSPRSNPARLLEYVCAKYFEGQETISEHDIAVEVFGRRPSFDPQKDAIVRVEAHRVRKRLSQFYQEEGAGRKCRLVIPHGAYVPVFTENGIEALPAADAAAGKPAIRIRSRLWRWAVALVVVAVMGAFGTMALVRNWNREQQPVPVTAPPVPDVRIMTGSNGDNYADRLGRIWSADRFFDGGAIWRPKYRRILRAPDPLLFLTAREGTDFSYDIPLEAGLYELRLYFAETFFGEDNQEAGGESSRMFNIFANGVRLLTNFDPLSDAGGSNTADVRVFTGISPDADGKLHLRFKQSFPHKGVAFVNSIELIRTNSRAMLPVRWVASATAQADSLNRTWQPDQLCYGGRVRIDVETVTGTPDAELYRSERYGNFSYAVPVVAQGSYTLTLHFAEHWFGIQNRGGPSIRLFNVFCNGVALLRDFDLAAEAGGSLKALKKTFRGLKPNAQGKLVLSFVPIMDYATVDALEVLDESAR